MNCFRCDGTGEHNSAACPRCNGTGQHHELGRVGRPPLCAGVAERACRRCQAPVRNVNTVCQTCQDAMIAEGRKLAANAAAALGVSNPFDGSSRRSLMPIRKAVVAVLREQTDLSWSQIACALGLQSHALAIYHYRGADRALVQQATEQLKP